MRVYDMIVDERFRMAELLADLSAAQLRQQSLCTGWSVHDVAAHLISFLRYGQAKLYAGIVATAGDIGRINLWLTAREARRPTREIVDLLRRDAGSRISIPRSGYDPVLTDVLLHDLDVRRPLGIARSVPEDRWWVAFHHLTRKPAPGYGMGARLAGLRIEATDTGWTYGSGPLVRGTAEDVLLGIAGRQVGIAALEGDGVPVLRDRVASTAPPGPARRLATIVAVLTDPPPPERRSRRAGPPAIA